MFEIKMMPHFKWVLIFNHVNKESYYTDLQFKENSDEITKYLRNLYTSYMVDNEHKYKPIIKWEE